MVVKNSSMCPYCSMLWVSDCTNEVYVSDRLQLLVDMYVAWGTYLQKHAVPIADLTHLWAWQRITQARLQAALCHAAPVYPPWPTVDPDDHAAKDAINAWIQATYGHVDAQTAWVRWRDGYCEVMRLAQAVPASAWDDPAVVPWLGGYVLWDVIIGTVEHHCEHLEEVPL
jgi:hypothetical protein